MKQLKARATYHVALRCETLSEDAATAVIPGTKSVIGPTPVRGTDAGIKHYINKKSYREKILHFIGTLVLTGLITSALAQEVSIPDPGLNAAIRDTLQKPNGPLTAQDMLSLTNLSVISRNIANLQGLETAWNLGTLILDDNHINDVSFPDVLTNMTKLGVLDLSENIITNLTLPNGLTNLTNLRAENGRLARLTLPAAGLMGLTNLSLGFNQLSGLTLPADMTNLSVLSLFQNQLTNLVLPPTLANLSWLDLSGNHFGSLNLPAGLTKLGVLIASGNQLTNFIVPTDLNNLGFLRLDNNQLTSLTVPAGLTNLTGLFLQSNQLTNLVLPTDLNHLIQIDLSMNQFASLSFPAGLTSLAFLNLNDNQLTNITLPPDLQQLIGLFVDGNPLTTFVLSEPLAATGMASVVDSLQNQGVPVFTYPLTARLVKPLPLIGSFKFGITGPPGMYTVLGSTNLEVWSVVGVAANPLGSVNFHDVSTNAPPQRYYRAVLQVPLANMVFIPPNTFMMGSPNNEVGHQADEGPQTVVTLTHGFWIGKCEVTQTEYLAVTGENPSSFSGDLNRPVESVSFFARLKLLLHAHRAGTGVRTNSTGQPLSSADGGGVGMRRARRHFDAVPLWRGSRPHRLEQQRVVWRPQWYHDAPGRTETAECLGTV